MLSDTFVCLPCVETFSMWMPVGGGAHDAAAAGEKKNSAAGKKAL